MSEAKAKSGEKAASDIVKSGPDVFSDSSSGSIILNCTVPKGCWFYISHLHVDFKMLKEFVRLGFLIVAGDAI